MSGQRAYPAYPQHPTGQYGQPGHYPGSLSSHGPGMPPPSTNQPPPQPSYSQPTAGPPPPGGVSAMFGPPVSYSQQHSYPGAMGPPPSTHSSAPGGVTSQLAQMSLGPPSNVAGHLDAPPQQHSRTPSPGLQPGPPSQQLPRNPSPGLRSGPPTTGGGPAANFYSGGPGQPPSVVGPGNYGRPPPTGPSVHHNPSQIGSGLDQAPPSGFNTGPSQTSTGHGFLPSMTGPVGSSTAGQTVSGPGQAAGLQAGPYSTGPPHMGTGMGTGPPHSGPGLSAGPPSGGPSWAAGPRLASGLPPSGSGLTAGPPPTGSGLATGSHPGPGAAMGPQGGFGGASGPPPTGPGLAAGPPPTGSGLAAGPPHSGSSLAAGPPHSGFGLAAGPPPTGSSLAAGPPPAGSNLMTSPPTGSGVAGGPPMGPNIATGPPPSGPPSWPGLPSGYQYPSSQPPPAPTSSTAQPSSSLLSQPPTSAPASSGLAGGPREIGTAPLAQQMHRGPQAGPFPPGHAGSQPAYPGQHPASGPGPTPPHQPSYAQATAGPNMHQLPEVLPVNLLENRTILPPQPLTHPTPMLPGHLRERGPNPSIFCCTMNNVPATSSLLGKTKLPLAIHIHPFKDVRSKSCPVINPNVIVRCRICRSYINPFVSFVDSRHWRCNMCFRTNAVPEDYDYNPITGRRGDRTHHNELKFSSVEYIAPSEYMVRPPQPSVYFFVIDVSSPAIETGVLAAFCRTLLENLSKLPGDGRTMVGFLTFDSALHFYNLKSSVAQPQMLVVSDIEDVFIPALGSLLVNLRESKELVKTLLEDLPRMFAGNRVQRCALGPALQVAEKLLHPIGGRITVILSSLPNAGPGALKVKEHSAMSTKRDQLNVSASTDFYKKIALECSAQQITVDLFVVTPNFVDLTTIGTVSKFSSGQMYYYNNFNRSRPTDEELFEKDLKRYLIRNIGFEAVMRIRCTEGLSLHTFHGNFFVRSTDLLSLPNVNPDLGYCMNIAIDESLKDYSMICFQAALLYTTYRGERRIRVHTLCLPVVLQAVQVYAGLNVQAIAGVLAKMAVDKASSDTLGDARDALMNSVIDSTRAYRSLMASSVQSSQFCLPASLCLLPLFVLALLKSQAFTLNGVPTLDMRAYAMNLMKVLPLDYLMAYIYPRLYSLHTLTDKDVEDSGDGKEHVVAPLMHLSAEKLSRYGVYLMDHGMGMCVWVSKDTSHDVIQQLFGVKHYGAIPGVMTSLPAVEDSNLSYLARSLVNQVRSSRQHFLPLLVIREDGPHRLIFVNRLLEDKTEDGTTYYEFLSHVSRQINK